MGTVQVDDKAFDLFLNNNTIQQIVQTLATEMTEDLSDKFPVFLPVLNGSFMFAADLFRNLPFASEICFVKCASYEGCFSSGKVHSLIGLEHAIRGRTLVIIEDIIETGNSLEFLLPQMQEKEPLDIKICTLLFKPERFQKDFKIDYIGKNISNEFVVGYGMDYNGQGRNLKDIYQLHY